MSKKVQLPDTPTTKDNIRWPNERSILGGEYLDTLSLKEVKVTDRRKYR